MRSRFKGCAAELTAPLSIKAYIKQNGSGEPRNEPRQQRGEAVIWQRRFWEHTIRDMEDYHRHLDYIHFNPVKHGLVENAAEWSWSSFQRYASRGYDASDWGVTFRSETSDLGYGE